MEVFIVWMFWRPRSLGTPARHPALRVCDGPESDSDRRLRLK